ncbi:DUF3887 domain-containing protein [Streptomyces sp. NPDC048337]|uniref:DUF3887 domain-containing protein n=1 Tax=Streptomyces sp. NPDC048337 TaxID=3365535 RepID=UPI0037240011
MPDKDTAVSGKRRRVRAVAAVTLAACALLPVNGPASAATQADAASTVAAAPVQTRYDRIATQALDDIVKGDFTAATAHFDATVRKLLPPDVLAKSWQAYQDQLGRYQSHGDPKDTAFGELTVVNIPLTMEHRPGEFRVTFHEDGSIAGLWFLEPGVSIS